MWKICEIDVEKFKSAVPHIRGSAVVLTEERRAHIIAQRGPEEYRALAPHFEEVLENPDYIFKDKDRTREHTFLVCKQVVADGRYVNVVLRLAVEADDIRFEHSIITAMFRGAKSMRRTLRTHEILYSRVASSK